MKKKIIALLLATVIVVGAALGGTLAYLTDGQGSVNVATVGNVKIEQFEVDRNGNEFKQGQPLYPAYYAKDWDSTTADDELWDENEITGAIDKIVYVENTGRSDAYIRTWIALECPGEMKLYEDILVNKNTTGIEWTKDDAVIYTTIDGQRYAIICATYTEALVPGAKSVESLLQVAMAKHVNDEAYGGESNKTYEILAFTQAVQTKNMPAPTAEEIAAGIETKAEKALCVAFNGQPSVNNIPWDADFKVDVTAAADVESFVEAIENGGKTVYLANDMIVDEAIEIPAGVTTAIDLNGYELTLNEAIVNNGTLIIDGKDNATTTFGLRATTENDSTVISAPDGYAIENTGNLIINGGTFTGLGCIRSNDGSITINGGSFYASSCWQDGVYQHTLKAVNTDVIINGGDFDATVNGHTNAMFNASENGVITINGGNFKNVSGELGNFDPYIFTYEKNGKVIINDGTFYGGWRFNGETATTEIYGGIFTVGFDGQSFHANSTHKLSVYGGTFVPNTNYPNNSLANKLDVVVVGDKAYKVENADGTFTVKALYSYETVNGATIATNNATNEKILYKVEEDYAEATFEVPEGVDTIGGYAFAYNDNIDTIKLSSTVTKLNDRAFRDTSASTVILNEGLTNISYQAFRNAYNVKNVEIPSTVTTISKEAFQNSGIETLVIPANVTTLEYGACRDMKELTSVTIEGNVYIPHYAFRACTNLRTVYLTGEDVTFQSGNMIFSNYDTGIGKDITIYVKNETVKARLAAVYPAAGYDIALMINSSTGLSDAITAGNKKIALSAGTYTLPSASLTDGTTLICDDGVVFNGTSSLNINGATIIGATFKNDSGSAVKGTINGTFKDCTFTGSETLRWCYTTAGTTTVFENCVIETTFRGFHFDDMAGNVIFRNCEINGFNAYGGEGTITFENCTFGNDASKYNGLNIYSNTVLKDCTFNYTSGKTNFIDMEGTGKTLTITKCTATLDDEATDVINFVGGSKLAQNTLIVDGNLIAKVSTSDELNTALDSNNTKVIIATVNAPDADVIIPDTFNGTLYLENCSFKSITNNSATTEIVINGNVVVNNSNGSAITGEVITISGKGTLTAIATGNRAYGIGGDSTKVINISDVTIAEAKGGHAGESGTDTKYYKDAPEGGAAIGSGYNGAEITLENVHVVKAIGGSKAAGIGALYHIGVIVNIKKSTIDYVEGGVSAAGIGGSRISGGASESGTTININGSTIKAQGGVYGAGIGSGYDTHCLDKQPMCTINIDSSTINATGGKYAAGVGTGFHHAALSGEIKNSTVTAVSGENFYKDTYTKAMDIGFGVVDPAREGQQTNSLITVNGTEIIIPAVG